MFDKDKFKELLAKAIGSLNMTEFSKKSGVNRTYISKYINKKLDNPPHPEILQKIADVAENNVTYEDLMIAAGFISEPIEKNDIELTLEEQQLLEKIKSDPELSILFHDLKSAPKKKIKQLLKTWEFVKEQFDNWEDEE